MTPDRTQNIALGIGLMLLGTFIFASNDVLAKWLAGTYSGGQILLFRSAVSLVVLIPILIRQRATPIRLSDRPGLQLLRAALAAAEVSCFYLAVAVLPLADTKTYYLAAPIYVTLLASVVLGEHVGWRRWTAVLIGFAGVLITLQPALGSAFGWPALIALTGSACYAVLMIVTRQLRGIPHTSLITLHVVACLVLGLVWAPFDWHPMSVRDMALTGLVGIASMCGWLSINRALMLAPASVSAPYQYTSIVWAIVFGYLVFAEVPLFATLVGAAIIVAAGLFIFFREQRVTAHPQPTIVADSDGLPAGGGPSAG